ncbi:tRNA (adenosine(37)-N6)-dimethylallyltransferase MiaA [Flavihumibacter sp. UBA7668]|uniref:tRNA (adenosine(37)-N6)-dimethylallyltransferase MiaA n=1 Tax=Flavihumibacter sp. UBA7668 TaxID=1946542 RepID=UPI0025C21559|nr:tRNA (adenosine(37)-N6)-dimethylallyltransferase MiaA [Flavihumibacter sp. UBA7668]
MKKKFSIIIAGPTAVGKTAAAISLAQWLKTEIISADSRQCFKELTIGVARPSADELQAVPHHFIASHSILQDLSAASFATFALGCLNRLFIDHTTAVIVGGTGLYIKALTEGLDEVPAINPAIRTAIIHQFEANGLEWLQSAVKEQDPLYYATGEILNPQRLMRALEVVQSTGRSIRSFQTGKTAERPFESIKIGLELPREELVVRINNRVDLMIQDGLLEEVKEVADLVRSVGKSENSIPALQTVGYSELFAFLNGQISFQTAIEQIKTHTRQYAKRQMTWFKKDPDFKWFHPQDQQGIRSFIQQQIS